MDIKIYEDKLGQSGDRILSSHITMFIVASTVCGYIVFCNVVLNVLSSFVNISPRKGILVALL